MWNKDVGQVFHFDDLQGLIPIVNTVSVHVSLAVLLVQAFFGELLTRLIKCFYLDSEVQVFKTDQPTEAFTVIYNLCS